MTNRHVIATLLVATIAAGTSAATTTTVKAVQEALEHLRQGRHAQAERTALPLATDTKSPTPRAWLIVARARRGLGRAPEAAEAYRQFVQVHPAGSLRDFAVKQISRCLDTQDAQPVEPAPSELLSAAELSELALVGKDVETALSDHFVVRARNGRLARLIADEAERRLEAISKDLLGNLAFDHTVEIDVWTDSHDYAANVPQAPDWSGGGFSTSRNDGHVRMQIHLKQSEADGGFSIDMLDNVLSHELCHLLLAESFQEAPCPLALAEGLAMRAEQRPDSGRILLAGAILQAEPADMQGELFTVKPGTINDPGVFYAKSLSFVDFLHGNLSAEQFGRFLDQVRTGRDVPDAIQRAIYAPVDSAFTPALFRAWQHYAITQAQYVQALIVEPPAPDLTPAPQVPGTPAR